MSRLYDTVHDDFNDIFLLTEATGKIVNINERAIEMTGYSHDELLSMHAQELCSLPAREAMEHQWQFGDQGAIFETEFMRKDGLTFPVEVSARMIEEEDVQLRQALIRDISERKQGERDMLDEKRFTETLIRSLPGIFYLFDEQGGMLRWNQNLMELSGRTEEEMAEANALDFIFEEDRALVAGKIRQVLETGAVSTDARMNMKDGVRLYSLSGFRVQARLGVNIIGIGIDITEKMEAEEAVRRSRDLLRSVVENIPVRVFWKDAELCYLGCNTVFAKDVGMKHPKELYGKDDFQMGWREQAELYRADDMAVIQSGKPKLGIEEPQTTPDGQTIWLRTSKVPLRDADGEITGLLGIYDDITEEKQAQETLRRLNRALKALSTGNHVLIHSVSEEQLLSGICRVAVEEGGYLLAWVGYARDDEAKSVTVMASHAMKPGYADDIRVSWDDVPEGRGPTGTAIRCGKTQFIQDIARNPKVQPWREKALSYGYQASIALPLLESGKAIGVLTMYAAEPDAFNEKEIALLEEMAGDLSYGIHMLRVGIERDQSRVEQQQMLERMQTGLVETVEAIAATVEMRDPYTAGHQRRVAELARAIAVELGMDEQLIH
ncbi:MAG TPA: PAS domain S-box protein, partial [Mariprofundaceae bacterium]|nr:PAS domain S-box protein [Mariprofundaceae bacterium]